MKNEKLEDLVAYVTLEERVWPKQWERFAKVVGLNRPGPLSPLILVGSIASDAHKRERLVAQLRHEADDPRLLSSADRFMRSLPEDGWHREPDPLSIAPKPYL